MRTRSEPREKSAVKGSFRRAHSRAARACEVCHARKVRCDVTIHQPCTNCVAFNCECVVPNNKYKGANTNANTNKDKNVEQKPKHRPPPAASPASDDPPAKRLKEVHEVPQLEALPIDSNEESQLLSTQEGVRFFINNESQIEHLQWHTTLKGNIWSASKVTDLDIRILKMKGAFMLPPQDLSDALVESFFIHVSPILPVVNRNEFMRRYRSSESPPLLLRQAIYCAGCHTCSHPALRDEKNSTRAANVLFYNRAKALFDADYEEDRSVCLQAALLLTWSLDGPARIKDNMFYWTRMAVTLAQSIGLHRWRPPPDATEIEKRMWKRIWWTVFTRDRSTACSYGRPVTINLEETDVPMIEEQDFLEDEPGKVTLFAYKPVEVQFFIHSVKLHEIMGLVLRKQYSVGAERLQRQNMLPDGSQCDMAMAAWVNNLPSVLKYSIRDSAYHHFLRALIYLQYYSTLCLAHRPQVVHYRQTSSDMYPSWGIAFQAAHMIAEIFENLNKHNELLWLPAFGIYTGFSACIMLLHQMESAPNSVRESAQGALSSIVKNIARLGQVWESAHQVAQLSEYIALYRKKHGSIFGKRARKRPLTPPQELPPAQTQVGQPREFLVTPGSPEHSPNLPNELFMVTQSPISARNNTEPSRLFPETGLEKEDGAGADFGLNSEISDTFLAKMDESAEQSGSDEDKLPDTLNMEDWFKFLVKSAP